MIIWLNSSQNTECFRHNLYTNSKHTLCSVTFCSRRFWDTAQKCCRARQGTDDQKTQPKSFACWITKAIETHTQNKEHIMLFHGNNDYANVPQCYVHKYTASLVQYSFPLSMKFRFYMQMVGKRPHLLALPDIARSTDQGDANSYWTTEENSHSLTLKTPN